MKSFLILYNQCNSKAKTLNKVESKNKKDDTEWNARLIEKCLYSHKQLGKVAKTIVKSDTKKRKREKNL